MNTQLSNNGVSVMSNSPRVRALRKRVMDCLYELRDEYKSAGYDFPRINVRIVEGNDNCLAFGSLGDDFTIYINMSHYDRGINLLYRMVAKAVAQTLYKGNKIVGKEPFML